MSNLIIGNKYVPISKSVYGPLETSNIWKKAQELNQPFIYFVGEDKSDLAFSFKSKYNMDADFFLESDVIPYKEEFVLPEEWCIKVTQENRKEIEKWYPFSWTFSDPIYFKAINNKFFSWHINKIFYGGEIPEINFEQFQEFVLKIKTNNMKQIGWKFKRNQDQFIKAACAIVSYFPYGTSTINSKVLKFEFDEEYITKLRDAEVLELWFEPVYEEEIKVGDIVVVTEEILGNVAAIDTIGKIIEIDKSDRPYNLKGISFSGSSWCKKVRKATAEEIELYSSVDIAGYKAEKVKDGIKFGCQTIPTSVLDALEDLMERDVFTTTLKIESTDITLDIIKKLKNL